MTNTINLGTEYKIKHTSSNGDGEIVITLDQVENLYIGKGNNCRCGCRGEYFEANEHEGKIIKALKQMASGEFEVRSIDDRIFDITTSVNGNYERAKTIYLK
jgi:hypothetical protein